MATKAHLEGNKRHLEKLDRGVFYVPKGELAVIREFAAQKGMSLNAYINKLIDEDMKTAEQQPE